MFENDAVKCLLYLYARDVHHAGGGLADDLADGSILEEDNHYLTVHMIAVINRTPEYSDKLIEAWADAVIAQWSRQGIMV